MTIDNLVVNPDDPFDNGRHYHDANLHIGEPRTAKVYQDYLTSHPPVENELYLI